ncbi:MAG TPA: hypothetical protein VGE69_05150 [Pseudomonadales bacterium]
MKHIGSLLDSLVRHARRASAGIALLCACVASANGAAPVLNALPEHVALAPGAAFELDLDATDADGDTVVVTVDGMPPWMSAVYGAPARNRVDSIALPGEYLSIWDLEADAAGNLYFSALAASEGRIVKLDTNGTLTVLARGLANPKHLALAPDGTLYYATETGPFGPGPYATAIHRLEADGGSTLVNDSLDRVFEMDADSRGNLILLRVNLQGTVSQVLKIAPADGIARVLAGSAVPQTYDPQRLHEQLARDGRGGDALFAYSSAMFVRPNDGMFVPDVRGKVRSITPDGDVTTLPFSISPMTRNVLVDSGGRAFLVHDGHVEHITPAGGLMRIAGGDSGRRPVDGFGGVAQFRTISASSVRRDGALVIADWTPHTEPERAMLRVVKFHADGLRGTATMPGEWELVISAYDGTDTVSRRVVVTVGSALDLGGGTRMDMTLAPGVTVQGGVLGGTIQGDAAQPGTLRNVTLLDGSTLRNVVIGEGVRAGANVRLLQNVRFESEAAVPPGLVLDAVIGYLPGSGSADGGFPGIVDLDGSVVAGGPSLLDEIRATLQASGRNGSVSYDGSGQLVYADGEVRLAFQTMRVESANAAHPAYKTGFFVDTRSTRHVATSAGRHIYLRPSVEDIAPLALALLSRDLYVSFDMYGVYMANRAQGRPSPVVALMPDPASRPARAGLSAGFHLLPHPQYPGHSFYLHVYARRGALREQAFYPTAAMPSIVEALVDFTTPDDLKLLPAGGVELRFGGRWLKLMPALGVTPTTIVGIGFRAAGDVNGDGLQDYRMVYPAPVALEQLYYGLPD